MEAAVRSVSHRIHLPRLQGGMFVTPPGRLQGGCCRRFARLPACLPDGCFVPAGWSFAQRLLRSFANRLRWMAGGSLFGSVAPLPARSTLKPGDGHKLE